MRGRATSEEQENYKMERKRERDGGELGACDRECLRAGYIEMERNEE